MKESYTTKAFRKRCVKDSRNRRYENDPDNS